MTTRKYLKTLQTTAIGVLLSSSFSVNTYAGAMCSSCSVPFTWNGFYAGLQAGYAWNKLDWTFNNLNYFNTSGFAIFTNPVKLEANGYEGGVTLGYNYQNDSWILGMEGEILGMRANHSEMSPYFPARDTFKTSSKWLTTVKGKIGHAHDDWLGYFTGGWAGGHFSLTLENILGGVVASTDKWTNGWTFGGGVEYRLNPNISVGLGYEYIRLLSNDLKLACPHCTIPGFVEAPILKAHVNKQIVSIRLNYYLDEDYY